MKVFLQKYGAYLFAFILFVALGYIYCRPVLSGKVLQSPDDVNAISAIHESTEYANKTGDFTWWSNSMFSGMPNFQTGGGRSTSEDVLMPLEIFFNHGTVNPAWTFIIYFICFFILLRSFNVNQWLAIVGAIAIALSSYFIVIISVGHGGKTITLSYMSVVVAGFFLIFRKKYLLGAVFAMFFSAIGFATHPQMAYYIFMMIGMFYLAEIWIHAREKRWKDLIIGTVIFFASVGIGLGTGCANIFSAQEFAKETMRGGHSDLVEETAEAPTNKGLDLSYATQWSYGYDETFSFLIPGIKGGSTNHPVGHHSHSYQTLRELGLSPKQADDFATAIPLYWGEQPFTAGNVYMGAAVCLLFLLGCLIVPGPYKWALALSTLFSVLLAWGYNFMPLTEFFFKYFPLYNKFRAVSSILIVAEIAMPLLGFLALMEMFKGKVPKAKVRRSLIISGGITAAICLFFALFGRSIYDFTGPSDMEYFSRMPLQLQEAILADRATLLVRDSWRSLILIVATFALVYLLNEQKIKKGLFIAALGVLVLVDMWPVDKRYFNDNYFVTPSSTKEAYAEQPWETTILQDKDLDYRVMNLASNTFTEARTSYRLKSIGGYSAVKLRRYQDLIDAHLKPLHWPVINMLNTRYLIIPDKDEIKVHRNPNAMGNAWFVEKLEVVDGGLAESNALNVIDLTTTAVLDREFESFVENFTPGIAPDAEVHLTAYTPKQLDYDYTTSTPGTIVFSEIYYPHGWKVTIDDKPTDLYRVNFLLRAVNVPEGSHHITFLFDPDSVRKGDTIAMICIIVMFTFIAAAIAWGIYRLIKTRRNDAAAH